MSRVGVILACEHYPHVSDKVRHLDAQLRLWLEGIGIRIDAMEVFAAYDGDMPGHAARCDAWIVSGLPLPISGRGSDFTGDLHRFLRAAAAVKRTILAVHHAEHVVHAALAATDAAPPATSPYIRSIRNPFRSFQGSDTLHRYDPATRRLVLLERPTDLCPRRLFGFAWQLA